MDGDGDWLQCSDTNPKQLTDEERKQLEADAVVLSEYKRTKLETEAQKNWDLFYKRNTTVFYKDRHWTTREFPELVASPCTLLEAGCGVGNFLFPLLEENPGVFVYACDFSQRAVDFVKRNDKYREGRCTAFQCDLTVESSLLSNMAAGSADFCSLIFVLSAVHPNKMITVLKNIHTVLKAEGCVLVRDYGLYDHAMMRFKPGHKLADNFYVRQDNTRAYYFSLEKLDELFAEAGYVMVTRSYVRRRTVNKKEDVDVPRIFIQGKYQKPTAEPQSR